MGVPLAWMMARSSVRARALPSMMVCLVSTNIAGSGLPRALDRKRNVVVGDLDGGGHIVEGKEDWHDDNVGREEPGHEVVICGAFRIDQYDGAFTVVSGCSVKDFLRGRRAHQLQAVRTIASVTQHLEPAVHVLPPIAIDKRDRITPMQRDGCEVRSIVDLPVPPFGIAAEMIMGASSGR
ncbi:hypothetical protein ACVOMV_27435 (plasmid) [Mesorhizobium atlanticum]|uniref:hypothetical protein n=1 Tax=Mesorhizobium atlanticum TaxID=2233532 RepID=UPI003704B535